MERQADGITHRVQAYLCLTYIMHVQKKTTPGFGGLEHPEKQLNFALGVLFYYTLYDFHSVHIPVSLNIWEGISKWRNSLRLCVSKLDTYIRIPGCCN